MYKIIGIDGQQYGPVSANQIRQWIAEGRIEHQTPVFVDGAKDWNFTGLLPEFAGLFAGGTPPPMSVGAPDNFKWLLCALNRNPSRRSCPCRCRRDGLRASRWARRLLVWGRWFFSSIPARTVFIRPACFINSRAGTVRAAA